MKKIYSKPGIVYEDFSLCTHVAKTCDVELGTLNQGECGGYNLGSMNIFMHGGQAGCEYEIEDDVSNGICYHVPINGLRLFNS